MSACSYLSAAWPGGARSDQAASATSSCPSGFAGHLRLSQPKNGPSDSTPSWVLTIHDQVFAANVCDTLRGSLKPSVSTSGVDVIISSELCISLDGRGPISMRLMHRVAGRTVHLCDGRSVLDSTDRGARCGCPASWDARRLRARAGSGPRPHVRVRFRLANLPNAGVFEFSTTSWDFAEAVQRELGEVGHEGGSRDGVIGIDSIRFPARTGLEVSYCRPVLKLGPYG